MKKSFSLQTFLKKFFSVLWGLWRLTFKAKFNSFDMVGHNGPKQLRSICLCRCAPGGGYMGSIMGNQLPGTPKHKVSMSCDKCMLMCIGNSARMIFDLGVLFIVVVCFLFIANGLCLSLFLFKGRGKTRGEEEVWGHTIEKRYCFSVQWASV